MGLSLLPSTRIVRRVSFGKTNHSDSYLGWNQNANVVFLDQPAMVGYSFSSNKTAPINNTPDAAVDVYAFLQLFLKRFDEYATRPFHLAAESYGGDCLGPRLQMKHKS